LVLGFCEPMKSSGLRWVRYWNGKFLFCVCVSPHYFAQAGLKLQTLLELQILLPQPPKCWDFPSLKCTLQRILKCVFFFFELYLVQYRDPENSLYTYVYGPQPNPREQTLLMSESSRKILSCIHWGERGLGGELAFFILKTIPRKKVCSSNTSSVSVSFS
jgi:hypothetical protein